MEDDQRNPNILLNSMVKIEQTLEHLISRGDQLPLGAMTKNDFINSLKFSLKKTIIKKSPCFEEVSVDLLTNKQFENIKECLHNHVINTERLNLHQIKLIEELTDEVEGGPELNYEPPFIYNNVYDGADMLEDLIIYRACVLNRFDEPSHLDLNLDQFFLPDLLTKEELATFDGAFINNKLDTSYITQYVPSGANDGVLVPGVLPCFFQNNISFEFENAGQIPEILGNLNQTINIYNTNHLLIQKTYNVIYNKFEILVRGNQLTPEFNSITNKIQHCKDLHYNGNLTVHDLSICINDFIMFNSQYYGDYFLNEFIRITGLNYDFNRLILSFMSKTPFELINKLMELGLWVW